MHFNYTVYCNGQHIRLAGHEDDYICNSMWRSGHFYEEEMLVTLAQKYPVQKTIIDVGAHVGNHSVFFMNFMEYEEIHAFEPYEGNRQFLEFNLFGRTGTHVHPFALSDKDGSGKMIHHETVLDHGSVHLVPGDEVQVLTLDHYDFTNVTLIKIDAEGFDVEVIKGGMNMIMRDLPTLVVELNGSAMYQKCHALIGHLYVPVQTWNFGGQTYELVPRIKASTTEEWDADTLSQ